MGNKPQTIHFEVTRKHMKDSFVQGRLETGTGKDLPAPRKGLVSPVIDTSEPVEKPQSPIHVNFNASRFSRKFGRRSSLLVREAVADYERREVAKAKKQQPTSIQQLLSLAKRRAEANSSLVQFEDSELKSPVAPTKSKSVVLTRSASVGKAVLPQQRTLKLLPAQSKPVPVPKPDKPHSSSLGYILKSTIQANFSLHPFAKSLDGQWTRPVRGNSTLSFSRQELKATFSEMVRLREQRGEEDRGGAESTWVRRTKQREALPRSKSKV